MRSKHYSLCMPMVTHMYHCGALLPCLFSLCRIYHPSLSRFMCAIASYTLLLIIRPLKKGKWLLLAPILPTHTRPTITGNLWVREFVVLALHIFTLETMLSDVMFTQILRMHSQNPKARRRAWALRDTGHSSTDRVHWYCHRENTSLPQKRLYTCLKSREVRV